MGESNGTKIPYLRQNVNSIPHRTRKLKKLLWVTVFLLVCFPLSLSSQQLLFFFEKGCPHCAKIHKFLNQRIKTHYSIQIKYLEIHNPKNAHLMMELAKIFHAKEIQKKGTPAVFVGNQAFQGSHRAVQHKIEQAVRKVIREDIPSPLSRIQENTQKNFKPHLTLPAVLGAAAVDSVNPCACAVLVLLLGTILIASKGKKRSVVGAGFAFTAACFISYFLLGLGLFTAVKVSGIQHSVSIAVSLLAVLLGFWNIKDSLWKEKGFRIQVPQLWQPFLKKITSGVASVPGAFFMGFLISLFLLPCTSGPYIVIIGMLTKLATRTQAVFLLFLYNLIFVLPFIILTLAVGLGFTTTARAEKWRQEKQSRLQLLSGLFLLALGITLGGLVFLKVI